MGMTAKDVLVWLGVVLAGVFSPNLAMAQSSAGEAWVSGSGARLQTLDKITARISAIDVDVGVAVRLGAMQITIHKCQFRPPTMPPEHAALVEIRSIDHHGEVSEAAEFQGWMFASSPALNALEHPVYDVSVLACKNE